ncbi:Alpha-L-fucosidase [Posidoniimonas polymericola]|uniref:alpha-L-fucosidase n=1 Tax=Posidoniimonas polymericola TaxID=2528002 RepID=A0A5C5ZG03_9BACT|nr:alpha-L-fucosidase [Posidoniimonas polymericola]TWT85977.1 Alpha-L-fucosidase [Posidoniimonas polymericola]
MSVARREFLSASLGTFVSLNAASICRATESSLAPPHLRAYKNAYDADPRAASLAWFADAKFGLFMHYGLYSLLGRHEWVMYREQIPVAEYEKLAQQFRPDRFDADFITDLALEAGMKYVNLTSKHHDGFCMFDAENDGWNSADACGRDLCGELAEQCHRKGLGCFFYYSLFADWHHPYFYPREFNPIARPDYAEQPPQYKFQQDEDFQHYLEDATGQIRRLLTNYGPVAGIWFDPLMGYYGRPDLFPMESIYQEIRRLQPHCLISAKQGATGTEDFAAPERSGHSLEKEIAKRYGDEAAKIAAHAWRQNKSKHNEICDTMQPGAWGYTKADDQAHKSPTEVRELLAAANASNCNLLLNTGPLPDGSIHPQDVETFRQLGSG